MYFTPTEGGSALLFDGDKIASLAALLIRDLISKLPASCANAKVKDSSCGAAASVGGPVPPLWGEVKQHSARPALP